MSGADRIRDTRGDDRARLEAIAARVDDDPATDADDDPVARRDLGRMRAVRDALRAAGPARAPEGFGDAVLARLARGETGGRVVRAAWTRREGVLVVLQAASLAALVLTYGALLASTRVNSVGPRWDETTATTGAGADARTDAAPWGAAPADRPARGPFGDIVRPPHRCCVHRFARARLPTAAARRGANGWNSRRSASRTSGSSGSTTRTHSS